jgi:hypothetical protein
MEERMDEDKDKNKTGAFKFVDGLKPVDVGALADYEREMADDAIPHIIKDVERRRMLAAESRQRRLETPTPDNTERPKLLVRSSDNRLHRFGAVSIEIRI